MDGVYEINGCNPVRKMKLILKAKLLSVDQLSSDKSTMAMSYG